MVKRAFFQHKLSHISAFSLILNADSVFCNKIVNVKRFYAVITIYRLRLFRQNRNNLFQQMDGVFLDFLRNVNKSACSVRSFRRIRSLSCNRSIYFRNSCWIKHSGVDFHILIGKQHIKRLQKFLRVIRVINVHVNGIKQVITISAVTNDRIRKSLLFQILINALYCFLRFCFFFVC